MDHAIEIVYAVAALLTAVTPFWRYGLADILKKNL
jgi:hypothetical protein